MRWAQVTDTGLVRTLNEDNLCVLPDLGLFAVADGMGGHQAGEVASRMALQTLERELGRRLAGGQNAGEALADSIREANRKIIEMSGQVPECRGMGTTVTACLSKSSEIVVAQVGDSRAYLLRGADITRLTEDHSLVQELVNQGGITEEQAFTHPRRNVLTRALGVQESLDVDIYHFGVVPGDMLLLCTDGLTGYFRQEEIFCTVRAAFDPDAAVRDLLKEALLRGGADNITIILVEF